MGTFILIAVVVGTFFLGRHALKEGMSIEQNKKLLKNIEKYDKKTRRLDNNR